MKSNCQERVCLVVVYNHNFEKNIEVIKRIYRDRFSRVIQIMPFYRGSDPTVVCVYENSYQYNGYIAQARERLRAESADYYVFVADDMVIRPDLNETNIVECLGMDCDTAFISECGMLDEQSFQDWPVGRSGTMFFEGYNNSCEWRKHMPPASEARKKFDRMGLLWQNGIRRKTYMRIRYGFRIAWSNPWCLFLMRPFRMLLSLLVKASGRRDRYPIDTTELLYPTANGWADIFAIPSSSLNDFCHYCGVMAAARHFVEVSIATSLVLSCGKIKTLRDIGLRGETGMGGKNQRRLALEKECGLSYRKMMVLFPQDYLYIHPIKMSLWRDLP